MHSCTPWCSIVGPGAYVSDIAAAFAGNRVIGFFAHENSNKKTRLAARVVLIGNFNST